jgi:hypothetical protein
VITVWTSSHPDPRRSIVATALVAEVGALLKDGEETMTTIAADAAATAAKQFPTTSLCPPP